MAKHDEQVKKMMEMVDKKRADLGPRPKGVLVTNGLFRFNDKEHVNLNTILTIEGIIHAYSHVSFMHDNYYKAASDIGIVQPPAFEYYGHPLDDWKQDFTLRASQIQWQAKEKELNTLVKKLETLVSEDLKTENALAEIAKSLEA